MHTASHPLDARIPPVVVALAVGVAMLAARRALPGWTIVFPFSPVVGWAIALVGSVVSLAGVATFAARRTTANPMTPDAASRLVADGIYARTRNPMYVGMTLMLVGLGIALAHGPATVLSALFPLYIDRFQIPPEERAMMRLFGNEFEDYRRRVPRWL